MYAPYTWWLIRNAGLSAAFFVPSFFRFNYCRFVLAVIFPACSTARLLLIHKYPIFNIVLHCVTWYQPQALSWRQPGATANRP